MPRLTVPEPNAKETFIVEDDVVAKVDRIARRAREKSGKRRDFSKSYVVNAIIKSVNEDRVVREIAAGAGA